MFKKIVLSVVLAAVIALAAWAYWHYAGSMAVDGHRHAPVLATGDKPSGSRQVRYWVDPMHPQYKSDRPGTAPDCGMDLVPVYEEEDAGASQQAGTIRVSAGRRQTIGVRYGEVVLRRMRKDVLVTGRITFDETRIVRVYPKIDGWIEQVYADFTGRQVRQGEPLVEIYSPALLSTQQEFLLAARARQALGSSPFPEIAGGARSLYEASRKRLQLWDIDAATIDAIEASGEARKTLTLAAPASGVVIERNAFPQQRVTAETELYRLADLSQVWVLAELHPYEAGMLAANQQASISFPYSDQRELHGEVDFIYPQLQSETRTIQVRIPLPNPDGRIKPDTFVRVTLPADYGVQTAVPAEAVLDSGTEQRVFVVVEDGVFEPRSVRLGEEADGYYSVREGLKPGDRVVTSGNFLIDSESRMQAALASYTSASAGVSGTTSSPPPGSLHEGHVAVKAGDRGGPPPAQEHKHD